MTSRIRKSLTLFLALLTFVGPFPARAIIADTTNCGGETSGLMEKNDKLYAQARSKVKSPLPLISLPRCYRLAKAWLETCARESKGNPYCLMSGSSAAVPTGDTGLTGSFDASIESQINEANCKFAISHCYALGDNVGGNYPADMQRDCFDTPDKKIATAPLEEVPEWQAIQTYHDDFLKKVMEPPKLCWRAAGDDAEQSARRTLQSRSEVTNDGSPKGAIDCIDNDNGNRVCRYSATGSRFENLDDPNKANDPTIADQKAGAAQLGERCSGTLLGDGQTVVTAGHCTQASQGYDGGQQLSVYDGNGQQHIVHGSCASGQFTQTTKQDVSICKLDTPIANAKPNYVAVNDPSITGSGCRVSGYVKYCGDQYFQNLSQQPVHMAAYPGQFNESTYQYSNQLHSTTGTMYYDSTNKNLTTDMMCTGGCSGGGYMITDPDGNSVIVSANSYGSRFNTYTGGTVIDSNTWDSMQVQSVGAGQLQQGEYTMQSLNAVR